jgi:hypothetical protein
MTEDRRKNKKLTKDDVKKILNPKQMNALIESQHFGWRLKFIRSPLFQYPVPFLCNTEIDKVGILDPDGHINFDVKLEVRSSKQDTG